MSEPSMIAGRRRRIHSDEFKAQVVAACSQPGVSVAAVSMAHGVNANLARRWMINARCEDGRLDVEAQVERNPALPLLVSPLPPPSPPPSPPFVALPISASPADPEIRIELRRGATTISVTWPTSAASECAAWMRELLR